MVMNKVKGPAIYMLGSGCVNLCLTLLLMKFTKLGIYSVPLSAFLINGIRVGVFVPIYPCKELGIKRTTFYPAILKTLIGGTLIYIITWSLKLVLPISNWIRLFMVVVVSGVIGIFINLIIIFKPSEIKEIVEIIKKSMLVVNERKEWMRKEMNKFIKEKISKLHEYSKDKFENKIDDKGKCVKERKEEWNYNVNGEELVSIFNELRKKTRIQLTAYPVLNKKQILYTYVKGRIYHKKVYSLRFAVVLDALADERIEHDAELPVHVDGGGPAIEMEVGARAP
jgi:hypothetical protein